MSHSHRIHQNTDAATLDSAIAAIIAHCNAMERLIDPARSNAVVNPVIGEELDARIEDIRDAAVFIREWNQ